MIIIKILKLLLSKIYCLYEDFFGFQNNFIPNFHAIGISLHFIRNKIFRVIHAYFIIALICILCMICTDARAFEPVKIACITAETGIAATDNIPMIQAARMAVEEINKNGGLLGEPVRLIIIDNKSTSLGSKAAAIEAVRLNVTGVIGAAWSSQSLAMAPVLQKAKIPMITPISTNPEITKLGNYIFRICFTDDIQGKIAAKFARNYLKAQTADIIENISEQYSLTLSNFFARFFIKYGGKILFRGEYTDKSINFKDVIERIKISNPDIIFIPGYQRDSALIIKQGRKLGVKGIFMGGDSWETKMFDYAGSSFNNSYAITHWHKNLPYPESRHLEKLFKKKYHEDVYSSFIPTTYDAFNILASAIKKAGTLDRKRIRDVLSRTIDFKGATGNISFDAMGDPIGKKIYIVEFKDNKSVIVKSVSENIIKIAAIYPLTGKGAISNKNSIEGVICAIKELNESGGIIGRKIKLYIIDNKSTPIGSKIAAQKAVLKNVTAIIGSAWSSNSIAVAKIAQAHKIPMISNISTDPKLTLIGNYIFRVCFTDNFQGKVMAKFAINDLKAKSAGIFTNITSDYSMGLSDTFKKQFKKSGGKILFTAIYRPELKNYKRLIFETAKFHPDIIFLPGYYETGFIADQAQKAGINAIPLGGDGWASDLFFKKGGSHIKLGYFCAHWSDKSKDPVVASFVKKYHYMGRISNSFALSHDAVFLLADAIKRAHSLNRKKIMLALANTKSFHGVTGKICFDKNRNPVKNAVIDEILNGKILYFKTIKP